MPEPNPDTVFVADNIKAAEALIQFLASHDIAAEVFTDPTQTISEPITGMSEVSPAESFAIRVAIPEKAIEARKLIADVANAAIMEGIREKRKQRTGTVSAVCEECGKSSDWSAELMGTVATCPNCGAYMDIPDPEDDWSGVDFGEDEEKEEE
jgi:hypothetical protein